MEICDGIGVMDPEVGRFKKKKKKKKKEINLNYLGHGSTLVESRRLTCKILFQRVTLMYILCKM